jgi:large exoprotein involved in heme utilization and adhesion
VEVSGESLYGELVYSRLTNRTSGRGNVATSQINTKKLIIQDGGQVSSDTLNQGLAGKLDVTASDSIEIRGTSSDNFPSRLSALTGNNSASSAGDLSINTRQLIIENGADVTVGASGLGDAGNLLIEVDNITLNNQGSIKASTASGEGGNINLQVRDFILMRRNSSISTQASKNGNGGNIDINSQFIVANKRENSDIIANAERGRGGKIDITTQGIYGLQYRPQLTEFSDINASSQFGINGTVLIDAPDFDPNRGLINLPVEPGTSEVAQGCQVGSENQSQFVVTGRGGLPSNPRVAFSSDTPQVDWVTRARSNHQYKSSVTTSQPIVEATSLVKNAKGEVFLTETPVKSSENWQRMVNGCNG